MLANRPNESQTPTTEILPLNYGVGAMLDAMDAYENLSSHIAKNELMDAEIKLHSAIKSHSLGMRWYAYALQQQQDTNVARKSPDDEFKDFKRVADGILEWLNTAENSIRLLSMATKPLRRASTIAISTLSVINESKSTAPAPSNTEAPPNKVNGISSKIGFFERRLSLPMTGGIKVHSTIPESRPVPPPLPPRKPSLTINSATSPTNTSMPTPKRLPPPLPRSFSLGTLKSPLSNSHPSQPSPNEASTPTFSPSKPHN